VPGAILGRHLGASRRRAKPLAGRPLGVEPAYLDARRVYENAHEPHYYGRAWPPQAGKLHKCGV